MPSVTKTVDMLAGHRSKREKAARRAGEAAVLSGERLKIRADVRADPEARKVFNAVRRQLEALGKADDIYSGCLNDYALLCSEQIRQAAIIERLRVHLDEIQSAIAAGDLPEKKGEALALKAERMITAAQARADRLITAKLFIANRNLMTMSAGAAAAPEAPKTHKQTIIELLNGG